MKKPPKQPYRLWGGRFEKGAGEQLETFSRSLQFDYRLAQADIRGTKAYVGELQRLGIFSRPEAEKISKSLDGIATEAAAAGEKYFEGAAEEDIHTFLLGKLRERTGELADKVHTGRSRNEQVALDFRLWLKDAIGASQFALKTLLGALLEMGEKHSSVILPGYTHLRRAQPLLWPHYLLAYFEMFSRDYQRLERCFESADVMPLGSGAPGWRRPANGPQKAGERTVLRAGFPE